MITLKKTRKYWSWTRRKERKKICNFSDDGSGMLWNNEFTLKPRNGFKGFDRNTFSRK